MLACGHGDPNFILSFERLRFPCVLKGPCGDDHTAFSFVVSPLIELCLPQVGSGSQATAMRSTGPLENYSAAMCGELALKAWWEDGRRRSAWAMGLERQLLSWNHLVHGQKGASL